MAKRRMIVIAGRNQGMTSNPRAFRRGFEDAVSGEVKPRGRSVEYIRGFAHGEYQYGSKRLPTEGKSFRVGSLAKKATRVLAKGRSTVVKLYDTPIVTFNSKTIKLRTGGWLTPTTKHRINQAADKYGLPVSVTQMRGKFYVNGKPFKEGMVIKR